MPELPEVETVKRSLESLVKGKTIQKAEIFYAGIIKKPDPQTFRELLLNRTIDGLNRRGKYLLFALSGGYTLVIHLRMTGRLIFCSPAAPVVKHTHLIFHLSGDTQLRFVDIRKFGLVYLIPTGEWEQAGGLAHLGPEPLENAFTLKALCDILAGKKGKIKGFLLDQTQIAGIGNIYADEILFAAGLHPERRTETLSGEEVEHLYRAIRETLAQGVEFRGTSVKDYVDGRGEKGSFQNYLKVYDRGGQTCVVCGETLIKKEIAGRGSVYCPKCQSLNKQGKDNNQGKEV